MRPAPLHREAQTRGADLKDALADFIGAFVKVLGRDVDDAACIGDVVGHVDQPAFQQEAGDIFAGELVVGCSANDLGLQCRDGCRIQHAAKGARREDIGGNS